MEIIWEDINVSYFDSPYSDPEKFYKELDVDYTTLKGVPSFKKAKKMTDGVRMYKLRNAFATITKSIQQATEEGESQIRVALKGLNEQDDKMIFIFVRG